MTLQQAFDAGLAAANLNLRENTEAVTSDRGIGQKKKTKEEWLLEVLPGGEEKLQWKLPSLVIPDKQSDINPNQILIEGLSKVLTPLNPNDKEAKQHQSSARSRSSERRRKKGNGNNEKRDLILKSLPLPISEQIEKLFAPKREVSQVFYDSYCFNRLKQLLFTYDIAIEIPVFILLAQLFNVLTEGKLEGKLKPAEVQVIEGFIKTSTSDRLKKLYFPLIRLIISILEQNQIALFVPELAKFQKDIEEDKVFEKAFQGLEAKKERLSQLKTLDDAAMIQECIEAEEMLTLILSKLHFLAIYSMKSIRKIDVMRNRVFQPAVFTHHVVSLRKKGLSSTPEEVSEDLDDYLASESVLLMRKQPLADQKSFLNLTPFVIDENAFLEGIVNIKLHFFQYFKEKNNIYIFKHTYKPEDKALELRAEGQDESIQDVWDQFEEFRVLLQKAAQ